MRQIETIPNLPPRKRDANKGDFGKVLIVGGSRAMLGAPSLAANAALRAGAGLVTVAVPRSIQPFVVSLAPCATSIPLAEDDHGLISEDALPELLDAIFRQKRFDVVAIGPGLGKARPVLGLIHEISRGKIPVVIDADGLNLLSEIDWHGLLTGPCVITPHPGELARLLKTSIAQIQADRQNQAAKAVEYMTGVTAGAVCLLKGEHTVVTDGERMSINRTGNPGMATGGTGDVLTGVIAGLLGQGLEPFEAAVLGAHVHGRAGDLAIRQLGEVSLIASDLIDSLSAAFMERTSQATG